MRHEFVTTCLLFIAHVICVGYFSMALTCGILTVFTIVGSLVGSISKVQYNLPDRVLIFTNWEFALVTFIFMTIGIVITIGTMHLIRRLRNELK